MAATYNFADIVQGDTFRPVIFTFDRDGYPIDLTDASVCMELKRRPSDPTAVHEFDITITDAVNGQFTVNQWNVDIAPNSYVYDLVITEADGRVLTYIRGTFNVLTKISKCLPQ